LPATRFVLKYEGMEVAEGRTNAEGMGAAFVPSRKELTVTVYNDNLSGSDSVIVKNVAIAALIMLQKKQLRFLRTTKLLR